MFKHFLIPTDGSPATRRAAKAGIALARRLGAQITAYCALEAMQPIYAEGKVDGKQVAVVSPGFLREQSIGFTGPR